MTTAPAITDVYADLDPSGGFHHGFREDDIGVTDHAQHRYIERVDDSEYYPRTRIKREFAEATDVELDDDRISDPTRIHPDSGVAYVYDPVEATIITCFVPTPEQLQGTGVITA